VFREFDHNEAEYSQAVAARFGTHHHELVLSQRDALAALPDAIRAMDQPTVDGINTYIVSREAHCAGVKVALTGLGGDEVFGGYSSFKTVPRIERFMHSWNRLPKLVRDSLAASIARLMPDSERNHKLGALLQPNGHEVHPYTLSRMLFVPGRIDQLFRGSAKPAIENQVLADRLRTAAQFDSVNHVSYLELRNYLANTLLRDADCMSMAHGVEVRVPFIDHKLVEFLFTFPGALKVGDRLAKHLLVGATRGLLPDMITKRRKQGFTLPFEHWLKDEMRLEIQGAFSSNEGPLADLVDVKVMRNVWQEFLDGRTSWTRPWALYVLHRWCEVNL
jgi:asparagine synthase (glutamine-hydrolysing)